MTDYTTIYVDGEWVASAGTELIEVLNPATGKVIGRVPAGTASDVDRAARAARRAQLDWAQVPVDRRVELLHAVATGIDERREEVIDTIVAESRSM